MAYDSETGGDPATIEDQLAADRDRLAQSLEQLGDSLSPGALINETTAYLRKHLSPALREVDRTLRDNPAAAAVAGLGLVWLILGRTPRPKVRSGEVLAGTKYEAISRWEDEGGPVAPPTEPDLDWLHETDGLRHRLSAALQKLDRAVRSKAMTREEAEAQRKTLVADLARDANTALRHGLESLPIAAQDRIAAARETAYVAGLATARHGSRLIEDRPFLMGGLAIGLGAGAATLFPQTETENRLFGAERDRLIAEAQAMLEQEKARASGIVSDFLGTVRQELAEASETLAKGAAES